MRLSCLFLHPPCQVRGYQKTLHPSGELYNLQSENQWLRDRTSLRPQRVEHWQKACRKARALRTYCVIVLGTQETRKELGKWCSSNHDSKLDPRLRACINLSEFCLLALGISLPAIHMRIADKEEVTSSYLLSSFIPFTLFSIFTAVSSSVNLPT